MKLTPSFDFSYVFGWVFGGFFLPQVLPKKGSSVELPSDFHPQTTKCTNYEQLTI